MLSIKRSTVNYLKVIVLVSAIKNQIMGIYGKLITFGDTNCQAHD